MPGFGKRVSLKQPGLIRLFKHSLTGPRIGLILMVVGITGGLLSTSLLFQLQPTRVEPVGQQDTASALRLPKAKTLQPSRPTSIHIAKINLDANIVPEGLAADGSINVPDITNAGWYTGSPTPGELGPSIIVGHVDSYKSIAVFWYLRQLTPGDVVEIDRADGSAAKFKVTAVKKYSKDNFPAKSVYGNIDYAGIRLITCGGVFDPSAHNYPDNIVVYGSLI